MQEVERYCEGQNRLIIVGTKSDLEKKVDSEKVNEFIQENDIEHIEASAKTGNNVDKIFERLVAICKGIDDDDDVPQENTTGNNNKGNNNNSGGNDGKGKKKCIIF